MNIIRLRPGSPALLERRCAILELIASSRLSLTDREIEDYLSGPNDVLLALDGTRLVGVCIATHRRVRGLRCLGFLLVVVHPDVRRQGLLGRLTTRYYLGELPRIVYDFIRHPRTPLVAFADVCNPVSYRRLHFCPRVYPDLVRGDGPAERAKARRLRVTLASLLGLKDLDVDTGLLRNSSGKLLPKHDGKARDPWAELWQAQVPEDCDLLVLIPVTWSVIARVMPRVLRMAYQRRPRLMRRRPAAAVVDLVNVPPTLASPLPTAVLASCGES